eukprot:8217724-Alexandrium_andersonii.AAC.1
MAVIPQNGLERLQALLEVLRTHVLEVHVAPENLEMLRLSHRQAERERFARQGGGHAPLELSGTPS